MALQSILNVPRNPSFDVNETEDLHKNEIQYLNNLSPLNIPASLINQMNNRKMLFDKNGKNICINYNKGTTTLAFKYQGGICVAVDSRATGGQIISSSTILKIIKINNYIIGTMAGGAADCIYWNNVLSTRCRLYELRNRKRITVGAAAKLLSNMIYEYKGTGLSLGVMICGYDKKGPGLYYVDNNGMLLSGNIFSVGSGSTYAYGCLDMKYNFDLTDQEAFELAKKSIYHATYRDIASGGFVRVLSIKEDGYKMISAEDCKHLHYKYQDEKMN